MKLYLPDATRGYYRGTRFDWSGVVASLEYQDHQYFGQWFEKYDPKTHDAIMGPVEEFTALGYDEAAAGGTFVKVGVGVLRKPDSTSYAFSKTYEMVDPGSWVVKKRADRVTFVHELTDSTGYAYVYRKTLRLVKGKPQLVLEHSLKNTGSKTLVTSVYNHNFFTIDHLPTGPGIEVIFPFQVQATGRGIGDIAQVSNNKITYLRTLNKDEHVYSSGLQGLSARVQDYDIRIENHATGAGVRITGDQPLQKIVYWASSTTSCPEPYIQLQAEPGQEAKWQILYEFYTLSQNSPRQ
jgi:hypothetical protein